jgi:hypothetical protein
MSFIRPELAAAFGRWREAIIWSLVLFAGVWLVGSGLFRGDLLHLLAGGGLAAAGGSLLRGAIVRSRLAVLPPGAGVVLIDEGRIALLGPFCGGFIDLESLIRVEIVAGAGPIWRLFAEDGTVLEIPLAARGAERLPDALEALPGISLTAGLASLSRPGAEPRVIWRKAAGRLSSRSDG